MTDFTPQTIPASAPKTRDQGRVRGQGQGQTSTGEEFADAPMMVRSTEPHSFLRVNAAFRAVVGFSDAELAERPLLDWIVPEDREAVRRAIAGGDAGCRARHITQSGEPLILDLKVTGDGEDVYVLGRCAFSSTEPAPEMHLTGQSMKSTLRAIAQIVEQQHPGYKCSILLIADGHFVSGAGPSLPSFYNEAIDGVAFGPLVGSCGTAIFWNVPIIAEDLQVDPLWTSLAELAAKAGVAACWSHPFTSQTGRVLGALALYASAPGAPTVEQLSSLKSAAQMTGLAVERGLAEEELARQRKRESELEDQLRQAAKMESLGVLAGGIAHDFNNILTSVLGTISLAETLVAPSSEMSQLLTMAMEGAQRGAALTQQLLTFAKGGEPIKSLVHLENVLEATDLALRGSDVSCTRVIPDGLWAVAADRSQLEQVVQNLIINADQAMPGGGEIHLVAANQELEANEVGELAPGPYVRISIADQGPGIPVEQLSKIFDPFFTTKPSGNGLGLAIAFSIVTGHGGLLTVDSGSPSGATFHIWLPARTDATVTPGVPTQEDAPAKGPLRVLLMDDEISIRETVGMMLRTKGHSVDAVCSGTEVLQRFQTAMDAGEPYDVVILDLTIRGGMGGKQAMAELRKFAPDARVLVSSGYSDHPVMANPREYGFCGVISKPYTAAALDEAILGAFRQR